MNLTITPPQNIADELLVIDEYLNIAQSEEMEEAVLRGNDLNSHMARSGKLLADAKYHLNTAMKSEIMEVLRENAKMNNVSHTATNALIKSLCKNEQYLVDWADRVNATCTHQLDWCRTLISKGKEEMRLAGMQRT